MIGCFKCNRCKNRTNELPLLEGASCKAFPNGIPEEKVAFISKDPCIDCNNGIGFEPKENK